MICCRATLYCDMQMVLRARALCANSHDDTPRQSNVVKDDSPKINKPLYKSCNGIKLIFIISAQGFLARKSLFYLPVVYSAVVRLQLVCFFILWSDLHLWAFSACSQKQRTSEAHDLSIPPKSHAEMWNAWLYQLLLCVCVRRGHKEKGVMGEQRRWARLYLNAPLCSVCSRVLLAPKEIREKE